MSNSKSEYLQLLDYINKNKINTYSQKKKKKSKSSSEPNIVEIDNRLKKFFNLGFLQTTDTFKSYITDTIKSEIIDELTFEKSFFTCKEVVGCHRCVFYECLNYEATINKSYLDARINYIIKTNYRNILLELCNFKNNQVIINHKNKIKDVISAIQDNVMIDFDCHDILDVDTYILKAIIYNNGKDISDKIKRIKIFSFGVDFVDLTYTDIEFDLSSNLKLLDRLNILRNAINTRNLPQETNDKHNCSTCLFSKYCKIEKPKLTEKVEIVSDSKMKLQPVRLKNKFLF